MERGLLWTPLLILFIWLAWSGWNEYQKVEIYRQWAENFDRAKYDIYSVLGQKDKIITWGKPTRKGVINLQTFSLEEVKEIRLLVNNQVVDLDALPPQGSPCLEFIFKICFHVLDKLPLSFHGLSSGLRKKEIVRELVET